MTNFIPIFPLSIVVYPGEQLNLHIFEPRYKQLVKECFDTKKPFGIPTVLENKVSEMGTLVKVLEISNTYEDGTMDIKTVGLQTFKILEIVREIPEKLYSGAIVNYPRISVKGSAPLMKKVLQGIRDIHASLNVTKDFKKPDDQLLSYDVAHHAGMSLQDEYYLLELEEELHRQEFLKRHLSKVTPVLEEMDQLKNKIKLNGHFKNLEGFQF
ncbi:LON peptidase substrate-binding domain-containing protein [Ferruginibacter sp. HRS2-29]|uniref:LON peptidase substrate-binding domain-containing protein n=1 Tax=Ferruginibacter sp. HRS2-29 TaxID=2487334 RepID=UPI0020CF8524|nr:LON peptidase substrate-binding domain-containing protein [Ferruginibacter sp. HRS2-29]MCP9750138.1 peptidase S16 [Ferruginibacter sp. HRS2-29]